MTMQQAMRAKLSIVPGKRVKTFRGWCRRDRVLLDGYEIGKIQTRRAQDRTEIVTIGSSGFVPGHNVDWLVAHVDDALGKTVANRQNRTGAILDRRLALLRRSAV